MFVSSVSLLDVCVLIIISKIKIYSKKHSLNETE